jgi:hypothetical protein
MNVADGGEGGELSPGAVALYAGCGIVVDPPRGAHRAAGLWVGNVTGRARGRGRRGVCACEVLPLAEAPLAGAGLELAAAESRQEHVVLCHGTNWLGHWLAEKNASVKLRPQLYGPPIELSSIIGATRRRSSSPSSPPELCFLNGEPASTSPSKPRNFTS